MPALIRNCIVRQHGCPAEPGYLPVFAPAPFVKEREDGMQTARNESFDSDVPEVSIHRSQERFFVARQVRRLTATGLLLVALVLSAFAAPVAAQENTASVESAVQWLLTQQAEDGGFIGFSGESDAGATVDAVLALASAQQRRYRCRSRIGHEIPGIPGAGLCPVQPGRGGQAVDGVGGGGDGPA